MATQNFIKLKSAGASANTTTQIDLQAFKDRYETNYFNILTLLNTSTNTPLTILMDGDEVAYLPQNNGVFEIKPEYLLKYSFLAVKNDTANALTDEIKAIVGVVGGQ